MNIFKNFIGLAALALCLGFASCSSDDDAPSYSNAAVSNSELMTILKAKGYQFDENGKMLLDDKANSTTSLDLSGTKVDTSALKELSVFPNLKELNLSNNSYGETFDFSVLPAQITGIDLTNNNIYNYDNLVKVTVEENGDETVENLHNITKLYLPEEAKYNMAQLVRFYRQNKPAIDGGTMDIKMQNENGVSEKYNTLREIPDATLRAYLNQETTFSGLFDGEKIDLSKRLNNEQKINNIYITSYFFQQANLNIDEMSTLEGLQYIIDNPYWEGTNLYIAPNTNMVMPKMTLGNSLTLLNLQNLNLGEVNVTNATQLYYIKLIGIEGMETLDLSKNTIWGQRGIAAEEDAMTGSVLTVADCSDLKSIVFPNTEQLHASTLDIEYLPKIEKLDLSKFAKIDAFVVGDLPDEFNLVYPNLTQFHSVIGTSSFACSVKTYALSSTVDFINKYNKDTDSPKLTRATMMATKKNKAARWKVQ